VDPAWSCVVPNIENNRAKVAENPITSTRTRHAINFTPNRIASHPLTLKLNSLKKLFHQEDLPHNSLDILASARFDLFANGL
jgi:hypothetical protein